MYSKIIKQDIATSKVSSLTIIFFIMFSSFLISTASIVTINLLDSIDNLMTQAQSPHYIQMHLGDVNQDRLADFAEEHPNVASYQALEYINIDNHSILINGEKSLDNSQDNGFSVQSPHFDYLLDLDNQIVEPQPGQVYIPLTYYLDQSIQVGDKLIINDFSLEVVGPIRDSQMNSTLSSSKRFLVHPNDLDQLRQDGRQEYLIEFLLHDLSQINSFQGDYGQAQLEDNGPTITYAIIKLINGISDGIMLVILLLVAIFVMIISFLCIRFTLLSTMEEDYQQIGVLKGIGLRIQQIKKLYLGKYLILSLIGCVLGYLISLGLAQFLLKNIYIYMGQSRKEFLAYMVGVLATALVFVIIMAFVNMTLNRFKKISPVQAIRGLKPTKDAKASTPFKLRQHSRLNLGSNLGVIKLLQQPKIYLSLTLIVILAMFMILLPTNIASTLASKDFIRYMGVGNVDIMMSQQAGEEVQMMEGLEEAVTAIDGVDQVVIHQQKSYEIILDNGQMGSLWVSLGDHQTFPVQYSQGNIPMNEGEIALSQLIASDLDLSVGDALEIIIGTDRKALQVSGIYSDITNGGKTGRAIFQDMQTPTLRTDIMVSLDGRIAEETVLQELQAAFPQFRINSIDDYRQDIFGGTIATVQTVANISMIISVAMILLIAILFTHLMVVRERRQTSIMKAVGLYARQIAYPYYFASIVILIIGIILGVILSNTLGQSVAGSVMESIGVGNFQFSNPALIIWLLIFALITIAMYLGTYFGTQDIFHTEISDYIKE